MERGDFVVWEGEGEGGREGGTDRQTDKQTDRKKGEGRGAVREGGAREGRGERRERTDVGGGGLTALLSLAHESALLRSLSVGSLSERPVVFETAASQ